MTEYAKIKAMVKVFKNYGISHPSKVMDSPFEAELGFDKAYLEGLIFDVEEALQVILTEEEIPLLRHPKDLFGHMLERHS